MCDISREMFYTEDEKRALPTNGQRPLQITGSNRFAWGLGGYFFFYCISFGISFRSSFLYASTPGWSNGLTPMCRLETAQATSKK